MKVTFRSFLIVLLIALTAVTYAPALDNDFVNFDDLVFIRNNPDFTPPKWGAILSYARGPYFGGAFPLTYVFIGFLAGLAYGIDGLDPMIFHAASIVLHAACVVLVFLILRLLIRNDVSAAAGAAVFAVHPVQVEAVAWVMNLNTLLSAALSLLAVLLYLHYAIRARDNVEPQRRRRLFVGATVAFVLAMTARPLAVTLPVVVFTLDMAWVRRNWRAAIKPVGLWLALTLPFIVLTQTMIRPPTVHPPPLWMRPIVALDAIAFYLWKLVAPLNLAPDYGRTTYWLIREGPIALTWVVPLLVAALVWWFSRRRGLHGIALLVLFVAPMLPVLGLVPSHFQEYSTVADRYVYVSMLAVAIAIAWIVSLRPRASYVVAALVIAGAVWSYRQTALWRDTESIFSHTLAINPGSIAANNALGQAAVERAKHAGERGEPELAKYFFQTALSHYETALNAHPENEAAHSNLANLLVLNGRLHEALPHYEIANRARPNRPRIVHNYAVALVKTGRVREAAELLESCINHAYPAIRSEMREYGNLHAALAMIRLHQGALDDAEHHFNEALRLQPGHDWATRGLDDVRRAREGAPATQPATSTRPTTAPATR